MNPFWIHVNDLSKVHDSPVSFTDYFLLNMTNLFTVKESSIDRSVKFPTTEGMSPSLLSPLKHTFPSGKESLLMGVGGM